MIEAFMKFCIFLHGLFGWKIAGRPFACSIRMDTTCEYLSLQWSKECEQGIVK